MFCKTQRHKSVKPMSPETRHEASVVLTRLASSCASVSQSGQGQNGRSHNSDDVPAFRASALDRLKSARAYVNAQCNINAIDTK